MAEELFSWNFSEIFSLRTKGQKFFLRRFLKLFSDCSKLLWRKSFKFNLNSNWIKSKGIFYCLSFLKPKLSWIWSKPKRLIELPCSKFYDEWLNFTWQQETWIILLGIVLLMRHMKLHWTEFGCCRLAAVLA